jgi:hypothetical protein
VGLAGLAALLLIVLMALGPDVRAIQCDGNVPRWMVDAQEPPYSGGGCAQLLPTHEAPPNADWSPYCIGLCVSERESGQ